MIRKIGLAVLFLALGSLTALAATVESPRGTQTITFDFHVDGAKLTGKVTTPRGDADISDGKIDGDTISFAQVMNFNGNEFNIVYTGKADGDTIKFTRQAGDRPAQEFVATRVNSTSAGKTPPGARALALEMLPGLKVEAWGTLQGYVSHCAGLTIDFFSITDFNHVNA